MDAIETIINTIQGGGHWGLRALCDDEQYAVGDTARESYDWDMEQDVSTYMTDGSTLGGTCAIGVSYDWDEDVPEAVAAAMARVRRYYGDRIAVLRSRSVEYGYDEGEVIMRDAEVMAVVEVA